MNTFEIEFEFEDEIDILDIEFEHEEFDNERVCERSCHFALNEMIIRAKEMLNHGDYFGTDADIEIMDLVYYTYVEEALTHKQLFREQIAEELIAEVIHPRRMMARISQFDDIERFFECC